MQCKRKVLEKAGSYIQSHVQATNGKLSKDQVSTYAAATEFNPSTMRGKTLKKAKKTK
jgi:hypothetical protein